MENPLSHAWSDFKFKFSRVSGLLAVLALLSLGAGIIAAQFIEDSLTIECIGLGAAVLLLLWWAIVHWRQRNRWLLDLQEFLSKNQMIPFHFTRFEGGTPWGVANHQDRLLRSMAGEYQTLLEKAKTSGQTLEKYVGNSVSEKASKRASESELGGELRRVYVLFSDVRGFTRMTEQLRPEETVEVLNKIFTAMEETLTQNGGDINKYIGDALFAYFRRPYGNEGEAAKMALRAASRMMDKFEILNKGFKVAYSKPIKIGLGIGVTAGEAILGNVGSTNRMEYTLIGDTVNMASRLCGIAENGEILVNEEMALASKGFFDTRQMDSVRIKGKAEPQPVYRVMGESIGLTN